MIERKETLIEINGEKKGFWYYEDEKHNISELYEWATEYGENGFAFVKSSDDGLIHLRDREGNLSEKGFKFLVKDFDYGLACVRLEDEFMSVGPDGAPWAIDKDGNPFDTRVFAEPIKGSLGRSRCERYALIDEEGRISQNFNGVSYAKQRCTISSEGSKWVNMAGEEEYDNSNLNGKVLVATRVWLECPGGSRACRQYDWKPIREMFEYDKKTNHFKCDQGCAKLIDSNKEHEREMQ